MRVNTIHERGLLTYRSFVAGTDLPADQFVHTVTTRSLLTDVFDSLTRKRNLDRGTADPAEAADVVVGRCALAGEWEVEAATAAAAAALPVWAATPLGTRLRLARGIRWRLRAGRQRFVDVLIAEGSPRVLAEWQVAGLVEFLGEDTLGWCFEQAWHERTRGPRRLILRRVPDGVVCVNPPQNAPATSAVHAVTALLAGNAVVLRAPRSAPLGVMYAMREFVVPALEEVGAPAGTLNVLCARPGPTIAAWLADERVATVFYTGGVERGLALERECVARGKKPVLELAGNDCVVVWREADLAYAAEALAECFLGSGQLCMAPNQVLVHPAVADDLLARLVALAGTIRPGYPEDRGTLLTPVLRSERFFEYVRDALGKGAAVVHGARRIEVDGSPSSTGMFIEPTVLRVAGLAGARDIDAVREETFFPLLPVIVPEPAPDGALLDAMIDYLNSNPYGLRNSVWARDPAVVDTLVRRVRTGGLLKVNDSHVGFLPLLPSLGGTGRTGGAFGEANYPMLRCSRLQGVSLGDGVGPAESVFGAYARLAEEERP
ncbi:MAG: aldehyde dehydrogenase family protein [Pseudonocardiaceae bacterium]